MDFKNNDFNAVKIRVSIAKMYDSDPSQFGLLSVISSPLISANDDLLSEEQKREEQKLRKQKEQEKKLIKIGYGCCRNWTPQWESCYNSMLS